MYSAYHGDDEIVDALLTAGANAEQNNVSVSMCGS